MLRSLCSCILAIEGIEWKDQQGLQGDAVNGLEGRVLCLRKVQMLSVWGQKESPWIFGLLKVRCVTETLSHHGLSSLPFFYRNEIHNSEVEA